MTLADAIPYHQLTLQAEGRSPATLRLYLLYEKRFIEYLDEHHMASTLEALSPITRAQRTRVASHSANDGHAWRPGFAARVYGHAQDVGELPRSRGCLYGITFARVKRPRVAKLVRQPFTPQEMQALWSASRQTRSPIRDEALLLLLLDTGARIGELTTLTLDKVRLDERHLVIGLHGKGRRERIVPIGDPTKPDGGPVIRALRAWLKDRQQRVSRHPERAGDRLFVTIHGYPLTAEGGTDTFKHIGAIAGVADAIPHRCRHTIATHWPVANPNDVIGLRRVIGHASEQVTSDYIHLAQSTIGARVGRFSIVQSLSAPKEMPRAQESIAKAWGNRQPEPPPGAHIS